VDKEKEENLSKIDSSDKDKGD